jgi:hypothetical protein
VTRCTLWVGRVGRGTFRWVARYICGTPVRVTCGPIEKCVPWDKDVAVVAAAAVVVVVVVVVVCACVCVCVCVCVRVRASK